MFMILYEMVSNQVIFKICEMPQIEYKIMGRWALFSCLLFAANFVKKLLIES